MSWVLGSLDEQRQHAQQVIRHLSGLPEHNRHIFEDWVSAVEDMLVMMPHHARHIAEHGTLADDPPEVKERFDLRRERYRDKHLDPFAKAAAELLRSTDVGVMDVIGEVYMQWEIGNVRAGQYFTPLPIAAMIAKVNIGDGERQVAQRLADTGNPADVRPITIMDPACGSGIMLLASAVAFPRWAVDCGLVQFFGQDIDATCAAMARINSMLYGLRGAKTPWYTMSIAKRMREQVDAGQMARERADELLQAIHQVAQQKHEASTLPLATQALVVPADIQLSLFAKERSDTLP